MPLGIPTKEAKTEKKIKTKHSVTAEAKISDEVDDDKLFLRNG